MNLRTWSGGLAALVLALGMPGAQVASARSADVPVLGRRTTIAGSTTAYTDVLLPKSIAPVRERTYDLTGAGRLTGFVLVKRGSEPVKDRPHSSRFGPAGASRSHSRSHAPGARSR